MAREDRAHNVWLGIAVTVTAITPGWIMVQYQVADTAERSRFWDWDLWPSFIPLAVALVLFVALLQEWRLPGLRFDKGDKPLIERGEGVAVLTAAMAEGYELQAAFKVVDGEARERWIRDYDIWFEATVDWVSDNIGSRQATRLYSGVSRRDGETRAEFLARDLDVTLERLRELIEQVG